MPAISGYQALEWLARHCPRSAVMLSSRCFECRQPVLEGVHFAWRSASAFDSALPGMPAIATLNRDDFRLFYQRDVRLFSAQNIRTSFGHVDKTQDNSSS